MTRFKFTLEETRKGIRGDKRNANKFKRSYFDASLKYRSDTDGRSMLLQRVEDSDMVRVVVRWRVPSDGTRG